MGYILNPQEVRNWAWDIRYELTKWDEKYQETLKIILELTESEELVGASYNALKECFGVYHKLAVHGGKQAKESMEQDLKALESMIGSQYLEEDILIEDIERVKEQCMEYEEGIAKLEAILRLSVLWDKMRYIAESMIAKYKRQVMVLRQLQEKLQMKLQFLYDTNDQTAGLFHSASEYYNAVRNAVNDLQVMATGEGTVSDGNWKSLLVDSYELKYGTAEGIGEALGKSNHEIVDLKTVLYELAENGGLKAVEAYLKEYYTEDIWNYLHAIGVREGGGKYHVQSDLGTYLGKYQIGPGAFVSIGWLESEDYNTWTDKAKLFGVDSKEDFLNNGTAQEAAMVFLLRVDYMTLKKAGVTDGMVGTTIEGYVRVEKNGTYEKKIQTVDVTLPGLLAAAHVVGTGKVEREYRNRGNWLGAKDGNGTYATEYMNEFSDCEDINKLLGYVSNKDEVGVD